MEDDNESTQVNKGSSTGQVLQRARTGRSILCYVVRLLLTWVLSSLCFVVKKVLK